MQNRPLLPKSNQIPHISGKGMPLQLQFCCILQPLLGKRGVDWMKVNRTYSMDISLVHQLRSKRNQSAIVCRALKMFLAGEGEFSVGQVPSRELLSSLQGRSDISEQLNAVITAELKKRVD